jgi:hypothetical protein
MNDARSGRLGTVGQVANFVEQVAGQAVAFLRWWDDGDRKQVRRALLPEIMREMARRATGDNNRIIQPAAHVGSSEGRLACRQRLGGILRYYYRKVA